MAEYAAAAHRGKLLTVEGHIFPPFTHLLAWNRDLWQGLEAVSFTTSRLERLKDT